MRNKLLEAAIEHFDPIYEQGHDITGQEIMCFFHEQGYPFISEVHGTFWVVSKRYPTRNRNEHPGIVAPQKLTDNNDYEQLAQYNIEF